MANYCILCGEEIPEHRLACGTCTAIMDSLPPDEQKKLQKALKNYEARECLRIGLQELKQQMRAALAPLIDSLISFIDLVVDVMGVADDGK